MKILVGLGSREHVEKDIKLIIVVNSERVIEGKILRETSQSFIKIGENKLSLPEERSLLDMVFWKSCREKRGDGEFLYNNLERKLFLNLENEADFMESVRKGGSFEKKRFL